MNAPGNLGFNLPCKPPLLPVQMDLLPQGLSLRQGLATINLDATGVDALIQTVGLLVLMRIGQTLAAEQQAAAQPGVILQ